MVFPKTLTSIDDHGIFEANKNLGHIEVHPDNPSFIFEEGALYNKDKTILYFVGKTQTGSMVFPDTLQKINREAIRDVKFTEIHFPESLRSFTHDGMLMDAMNLEELHIHEDNPYYVSIDGVIYSKDKKTLLFSPPDLQTSKFVVPDHVEFIKRDAFNSTQLSEITFSPDSNIQMIDHHVFSGGLGYIHLPSSITHIDSSAFFNIKNVHLLIETEHPSRPDSWKSDWIDEWSLEDVTVRWND